MTKGVRYAEDKVRECRNLEQRRMGAEREDKLSRVNKAMLSCFFFGLFSDIDDLGFMGLSWL